MEPIKVELDGIIVEITNISHSPDGKLHIEFQTDEVLTDEQALFVRSKMIDLLNEATKEEASEEESEK